MWLQRKYISLLSSNLRNFKKKSNNLYNLSCFYCGDSATNKRKARGYLYVKGQSFFFRCHNCGIGKSFSNFVKDVNENLYDEYIFERFRSEDGVSLPKIVKTEKDESELDLELDDLKYLCRRVIDDPLSDAYSYLKNERKLPPEKIDLLYWTEDLNKLHPLFPKYANTTFAKETRVIFPIYNRQKKLVGISARAIGKSELRYINLERLDEPMIFGLDKIDFNKRIYIVEGAVDSMFIDNAVAVSGSDFFKIQNIIPKENSVIIFDNQPRNGPLIKQIDKVCENNYHMFVWPDNIKAKDINAYYTTVHSTLSYKEFKAHFKKIIDENVFDGLTLQLKLSDWKKYTNEYKRIV